MLYTKTGDHGQTGFYDRQRTSKGRARVEAVGSLDELNAAIGVAVSANPGQTVTLQLTNAQHALLDIGSLIAGGTSTAPPSVSTAGLERWIDQADAQLPTLTTFILPGGSRTGASLHLARAICRRAERAAVRLHQEQPLPPAVLAYLNRLSDLLFVAARTANARERSTETQWQKSF